MQVRLRLLRRAAPLLVGLALAVGVVFGVPPPPAYSQEGCLISGTCTAEAVNADLGYWKYVVNLTWDTGTNHGIRDVRISLGLDDCPCVCDLQPIAFGDTVGVTLDTATPRCPGYYTGLFDCDEEVDLGTDRDITAWLVFNLMIGTCRPLPVGVGTWVFYSDWGPVPVRGRNGYIVAEHDTGPCVELLEGVLPGCDCPVPTWTTSWGTVKARYR